MVLPVQAQAQAQAQAPATAPPTQKTIIVGIERSFPPFSFINNQGKADGFSVELIQAIAKRQGLELQLRIGSWNDTRLALEAGTIDITPAMYYSAERDQHLNFSVPYVFEDISLFYRKGTKAITSFVALQDKDVGVLREGINHDFLRENDVGITPVPVDNTITLLTMLASGQIDYALVSRSVGVYAMQELELSSLSHTQLSDFPLHFGLAIAVGEDNGALLQQLNRGLTVISGEGTYEALTRKWLSRLQPDQLESRQLSQAIWWILFLSAGLVLLIFSWSIILKLQVKKRTQALETEIQERELVQHNLAQRAIQQRAVAHLGQQALHDPDLQQLIGEAEWQISLLLNVRYVQFLRYIPEGATLQPFDSSKGNHLHPLTQPMLLEANSIEALAMTSTEPLIIEDITQDARLVSPELLLAHGITTSVRVKLGTTGMPLGILCVDTQQSRQFNQDDINFVQSIANVIAEVIVREKAHHRLLKSESQFRAIFENSGIGMILEARNGQFLVANSVVCKMFGYSQAEFLTLSVQDITFDEDIIPNQELFSNLSGNPSSHYQTERRYRCKDGSSLWGRLTISVFDQHASGDAFCVAMIEDISQHKQAESSRELLEKRLHQAQKMEAIGQLTAGIAHDFNNILASMMGYIGLAQERYATDGNSKLADYLQQSYQGGERARDLIAQMLAFSRSQACSPEHLHPTLVIKEVTKLLRASLPKTIRFELVNEATSAMIYMDPVQLHQVMMNLCINARDAMNNEGVIEIGIRNITIDSDRCTSCHHTVSGTFLEVSVRDSGDGIEPEILSRVFEPFFTTKEIGKGTGMGLSAIHGIIHEHQGHVIVDSIAGQGTTFKLVFPVSHSRQHPLKTAPHQQTVTPQDCDDHILVVDDEPVLANYLNEFLHLHGYQVTLCENGKQALDCFSQDPQRYDLLLTDLAMPDCTGIELIQQVKKRRNDLPVILCTGYGDRLDQSSAHSQGVDHYFQKPVSADELLKAIKKSLLPAIPG